ncbi:MAG: hypothetical protein M4579_000525 [Chaenotheca gracillima]|nr:MAG: hypothetical protein M4579_000525 [Chaenotheca gracillima]
MSLLSNPEFAIYQLRTSYLTNIKDGVGDRLINVNPAVFNTPGFRAAGWHANQAEVKRTYSPPIPTAVTSEYFQAPPRSAGLPPPGFGDDDDEGGMVTGGGGSGDTLGPGLAAKRRRRREQMEEEDSSDLSDESDEEGENAQRAAQQIKFAKMPLRMRSGSSPLRSSNLKDGPSVLITSPSRPSGDSRLRRGSLGAVEAVKARARRDTTTSSEMSSENELDPSLFQRKEIKPAAKAKKSRVAAMRENSEPTVKESSDLEDEDSGDDSDGTSLSSEFAETVDSGSLLDNVGLTSSPFSHMQAPSSQALSPKKTRLPQPFLQALPPPRPISTIQPVSNLTLAIKAKRLKAASPFESFANLSGKGDPSPLHLRIYAPFSTRSGTPYEVPIRRTMRDDNSIERKVTVADCIGLSLWRYSEENISPPVIGEKMNVNRWTLRMVEDEEVDYDFPALDRTKPMNDFTSNNNRARARSNSKAYDEFALVEATENQFKENEKLTPSYGQESSVSEGADDLAPQPQPASMPAPTSISAQRRNPVLGPSFNISAPRPNGATPVDLPTAPASHATPRTGASKNLRVHLISAESYPQYVTIEVTTDTYLAEVLTNVCKKRNLDKAHHILKVSGTNVVAPLDRTVESLGDRGDVDLVQRRFGNDGPMALTGSPGSTPPNAPLLVTEVRKHPHKKGSTNNSNSTMLHPLAQKQDLLGSSANYKKYTVWRKQPMSFMPTHERILAIDGEYLHIMPGETGKSTIFDSGAKTTTIHFSSIIGCKSSRKHQSNFRVVVFKERESKRYDFEAQNPAEAAEIVAEIKRGVEPFQNVGT